MPWMSRNVTTELSLLMILMSPPRSATKSRASPALVRNVGEAKPSLTSVVGRPAADAPGTAIDERLSTSVARNGMRRRTARPPYSLLIDAMVIVLTVAAFEANERAARWG